jgi:hypothetical protein
VVRREASISEGDSRLDIVVKSRSLLACIEVKIQARESREQLDRYFDGLSQDRRGRAFVGWLLTEQGKSRERVAKGFERLLWSDVACALRRFAGREGVADPLTARSQFIRELASQYADFIASHFETGGIRQ